MHAHRHQNNQNPEDAFNKVYFFAIIAKLFFGVQNCPLNGTKLEGTLQGTTPATATCTSKGTVLYLSF